jgi:hypothetical protein
MRSAFALRINSGRIILNFGFQESLRTFLKPIFTEGVPTEKGCLLIGRQPFPEENKENTRPKGQSEYQNMLSSL